MPNLDGKGPEGKGPKTGRGKGNCDESNNTVIPRKPIPGRGNGLGLGRGGRGMGQGRSSRRGR